MGKKLGRPSHHLGEMRKRSKSHVAADNLAPAMRLVFAFAFRLVVSSVAAYGGQMERLAPSPRSYWDEIQLGLGRMQLDGTVKLQFILGQNPRLSSVGINLYALHTIAEDTFGRSFSDWKVPALQTYLVVRGHSRE